MNTHRPVIPPPAYRKLRAFAYDPSLSTQLENYDVSEVLVNVRWEGNLLPGPVGEYLEIVDVDPASECAYHPIDLSDPTLMAQNGLPPSEGDPQFHQQMVYAVAMSTIQHFERALGRKILWPDQKVPLQEAEDGDPANSSSTHYEPVPRLRIYPHAIRESNAYYDSDKKALLFGYFPARPRTEGDLMPGGVIFSCLSHDIIAHEMTHAILDGVQPYFLDASNVDVLAFHEAFADLIALFQHFTYPEILRRQIARARGNLATESLLGQLAVQFGMATGGRGALREAIGSFDPVTGAWKRHQPDPEKFATTSEPHGRGALLVATIFDAFLAVYRHRTLDLLRIATDGKGILPPGDLHSDLVDRLAGEATKTARHFLTMCIRAIDYCPPVDITFGDYLRALITADFDMVPDDDRNYRVALVEAFRRWGVYPEDVRTLSVESLRWDEPDDEDFRPLLYALSEVLEEKRDTDPANIWEELKRGVCLSPEAGYENRDPLNRSQMANHIRELSKRLHIKLDRKAQHLSASAQNKPNKSLFGLNLLCGYRNRSDNGRRSDNTYQVTNLRPVLRIQPDGRTKQDLVFHLIQKRPAYFDESAQSAENVRYQSPNANKVPDFENCDFTFRGGTTFIVDLETYKVRYAITKSIFSARRMKRQRDFLTGNRFTSDMSLYFQNSPDGQRLANLHSGDSH